VLRDPLACVVPLFRIIVALSICSGFQLAVARNAGGGPRQSHA